jgi:predicted NBD/HSP70 family sugar kinase
VASLGPKILGMSNPTGPLGNPRLLRVMNERLILGRLREAGPTSRVDLARVTGLSKPTVSAALTGLVDAGLADLVGEVSGRPGPVTSLYDMNASAAHVLGVDIGREWVRVAVADLRGEILARCDGRNSATTAAALVRRTRTLAHRAASEAGVDWESLTCAVLGSPGVFDPGAGRMEFAPNLPGWGEPGLIDRLRRAFDLNLLVENDVNLAAVGEYAYGHGRGKSHFVLVSIGTGVGMGVVIDGRLYTGAQGAAGEISYLPSADADATGSEALVRGPTETVVAAPGIVRAAQLAGLPFATAKEVFAAAADGDTRALALIEAEGRRIGGLVVAVAAVLDPEAVVLGGGVGRNVDLLEKPMNERIAELGPLRPKVIASALGEAGVLRGAIARGVDQAWNVIFDAR